MIICVTGLPGSGKTSFTKLLKEELENNFLKVRWYNSDWIRENLYFQELYYENDKDRDFTSDELKRTYNGLDLISEELSSYDPRLVVISEGTYRQEATRLELAITANKLRRKFFIVKIARDDEKIIKGLKKRRVEGGRGGASDHTKIKSIYEEPVGAEVIKVQNNKDLDYLRFQAKKIVAKIIN